MKKPRTAIELARSPVARNYETKTDNFIKSGKCFNDECKNKNRMLYIRHGKRNNKSNTLYLFKCKKCNSVFGLEESDLAEFERNMRLETN